VFAGEWDRAGVPEQGKHVRRITVDVVGRRGKGGRALRAH
jgi:hypothetical protein